uniref:Uncharacterized protein n=1 Tax=Hucho hucho TaxID=62062 RepID=A0A4W5NHB9_9TELE
MIRCVQTAGRTHCCEGGRTHCCEGGRTDCCEGGRTHCCEGGRTHCCEGGRTHCCEGGRTHCCEGGRTHCCEGGRTRTAIRLVNHSGNSPLQNHWEFKSEDILSNDFHSNSYPWPQQKLLTCMNYDS